MRVRETVEKLPFRFVLYPPDTGTFIGFRSDPRGPITFCSCQRKAVENRLRLWPETRHGDAAACVRNSGDFPLGFSEHVMASAVPDLSRSLVFSSGLCHRCNVRVPDRLRSYPEIGSVFAWTFRPYIQLAAFEFGVDLRTGATLPDAAERIRQLIPENSLLYCKDDGPPETYEAGRSQEWRRHSDAVTRLVEDQVRTAFGFPLKGAPLVSETILYLLVKGALPHLKIVRHFRHPKLSGLHFDIYVPEVEVAIEYQGEQHFSPFEHLGGTDQFYDTLQRDHKKASLCQEFGITLIQVDGAIELFSEASVKSLIKNELNKRGRKPAPAVEPVPLKRRQQISEWRAICEEIDTAKRKVTTAKQIALTRSGEKGFSAKNIMNVYYRWRTSGRTWESLDPYHALYKTKQSLIEALGLSRESVMQWLRARGITVTAWAAAHGFSPSEVSAALNSKRAGASSDRILRTFAYEMKSEGLKVRSELEQMKSLASTLQARIEEMEGLLRPPPRSNQSNEGS